MNVKVAVAGHGSFTTDLDSAYKAMYRAYLSVKQTEPFPPIEEFVLSLAKFGSFTVSNNVLVEVAR